MPPSRRRVADLDALSERELLRVRLCDLGLELPGSELGARTRTLFSELARRGLRFRPNVWLSTDWFSPDGVAGFAIPFYLAHRRLQLLEQRQMGEVEGGTPRSFRQLLRHETGHALDSAYRLHERDDWQEVFGPFTAPYHRRYQPKPYSKRFVRHLEHGYAQSHPAEDFAETLAVWLDPKSSWRARYRDWPALDKLRYVDRLMREIARQKPLLRRRVRVEPLSAVKLTLGEYYEEKRRRYRVQSSAAYERDLKRLFRRNTNGAAALPAARFIRVARPVVRKLVADRTGAFQYEIDRVLREMIQRSAKLNLVADGGPKRPDRRTVQRVARQVTRYLAEGHQRHAR